MLKKLLSKIKKQKDLPNPQSNSELNLNPINLITPEEVLSKEDLYFGKLSHVFALAVTLVSVLFFLMAAYNQILNVRLSLLKNKQDELVTRIENYRYAFDISKEVDKKSTAYKQILASRASYKDRVYNLYYLLPEDITIVEAKLKENKFTVLLEGDDPLLFARAIIQYLESGIVSQITLNSAILDTSKDLYTVEFTGEFK